MQSAHSFERIADTAARLFVAHGYTGVSLRRIADELDIKAASLYYHCPAGKTELFTRSMTEFFAGYQRDLTAAAGRARFPACLFRMTDWMLEHPPLDLQRLLRNDRSELGESAAEELAESLHRAVLGPFAAQLSAARDEGLVDSNVDPQLVAAIVVALVDGLGFQHLPVDHDPSTRELRYAKRTVRSALRLIRGVQW